MSSSLVAARILERSRLAGISLSSSELHQLEAYYELLRRWNRKINLTALPLTGYPDATIDRLIVEPLIAAGEVPAGVIRWFDFGSGGGSPAVPLKIVRPRAQLTMVESRERKASFLREVIANLALAGANVLTSRIEELLESQTTRTVELITARAVKITPAILETAEALLRTDGRLMLLYGNNSLIINDLRFETRADVSLAPSEGRLSVYVPRGT